MLMKLGGVLVALAAAAHGASYGFYEARTGNRSGGVGVILLSAASAGLATYLLVTRQ